MMNRILSIKNDIKRQKQSAFLLKNLGLSGKKGLGMNEELKKYRLMRKMDFARI
ncbi:hypothetical protein HMPREF9194_02247 [Treponema maltophilum ATCC 51939]|uniref:Uncharacterized protein n=1 Tax=Treponema maltophilum ATCC 51939 TaxID=1125699 RepID=S3KI18_TREMA|nr:hypothetical protein [Treponema maltophilum]EPF31892.1 hypothetical protein HMPREF9194_02247 [Treponema maltophilum ATCC 51939]